jgi:2-keto-4-pentenoate hydratase
MRKIRLCAGIWVALWLSLHAVPALASSHETLIGDIYRAYSERAPYPMPSMMIQNITVDQAYDIQDAFVRKMQDSGETVMGYKAGLTAAPAQKKFGVSEAVRGTLFKSMLRWPGTLYRKNFGLLFIETEIGFRFGKNITEPVEDIGSLKKAVSIVFPAIELPDLYYSDMKKIRGSDIIATNVAARQVLIGKALPVNTQDLNAVSVTLFHNGQEIAHGMGKNALGDQWKALQWTVNHVVGKGGEIKNGDIVITGSLTPMMPVKPGKYLADFGDFGTMEFEYK